MHGRDEHPDPAFSAAWRLFRAMHDAPSLASAEQLIRWLSQDPKHVRALDHALSLWALAGAALVSADLADESKPGRVLQ
jgi:ferric-dicitrate binding protein FerR (iron transport regulator)